MLTSYAYLVRNPALVQYLMGMKERLPCRIMLDSGGYTMWSQGISISVDEYCQYLDKLPFQPDYVIQLDVFGDDEKTFEYFETMQERGYNVLPVFTRGGTTERLESLYAETDYIAFGGIVVGGKNKNYVKWFMDQNKGRKCHWLGFTRLDFIKHYRPESVDCASWAVSAYSYGMVTIYKGSGQLAKFRKPQVLADPSLIKQADLDRLQVSRNEAAMLSHKKGWHGGRSTSSFITACSYIKASFDIEKNLGTKCYLAQTVKPHFEILERAYNKVKGA